MIMWIDAHCHLDDDQFDVDRDAIVARAVEAGAIAMVTAGGDIASSQKAVALAERYDPVYAVVGIHPHHAASYSRTALRVIRKLAEHPKVVGIGEIGLDFHYADQAPCPVQEKVFLAQLDLAQELEKPVVIHDRDAHGAIEKILKKRRGSPRGMLHCFSGDLEMAQRAITLGYWISFAGNVTFANAHQLQETARALPLEHILLETDAPYLSPHRGQRNEPATIPLICARLAELAKVDSTVVEASTLQNSKRLFGL